MQVIPFCHIGAIIRAAKLIIYFVVSYFHISTSLDADSKRWRLMADCLNDAAICLELALPLFQGYTTHVLCVSTAMKSIVGVAGN